jgi:hypothetical protein
MRPFSVILLSPASVVHDAASSREEAVVFGSSLTIHLPSLPALADLACSAKVTITD